MNRFTLGCILCLSTMMITSCHEKKKSTIIITKKPIVVRDNKPLKMGDNTQTRKVEWRGATYTVKTQMMAVDSLPLAKDGDTKYYDNRITLTISRSDGSVFFNRSFTKSFFREYVDDIYYKDGALLGIVYVKTDKDKMYFAASVGNPDKSSDEYVPLVLTVSHLGEITVNKDTQLDTQSDEEN